LYYIIWVAGGIIVGVIFFLYIGKDKRSLTVIKADGSKVVLNFSDVFAGQYLNIKLSRNEKIQSKAAHILLIFLSAGDCSNCLDEEAIWAKLSNQYDPETLQVVGILVRTSQSEASSFVRAYNFPFPILLDVGGSIEAYLPEALPLKVILNKDGVPIFTDGPNPNISAQQRLGLAIQEILASS
jgi:hypothetical protein